MKILALEYSGSLAGIAVAVEGHTVFDRSCEAPRGRGAGVFGLLEETRPLWRDADRLAVGIGPGSYNGLRVACATVIGLQLALGCDVVALPSPCLLPVGAPHYHVAGDARGGRCFLAEVRDRRLAGDIRLVAPAELETAGVPLYRVGEIAGHNALPLRIPSAAVLAQEAAALDPVDVAALEPLYLKPPHITRPRMPVIPL